MVDSQNDLSVAINQKIGFIGGGNIAKAICEGIIKKGLIKYSQIYVSGEHIENLSWWKEKGAHVYTNHGKVVQEADNYVFFTVTPNCFRTAIVRLRSTMQGPIKPTIFVSTVPGIPIAEMEHSLGTMGSSVKVIRALPNPAIMVGKGYTIFCPGTKAEPDDAVMVKNVFRMSSICRQLPECLFKDSDAMISSGLAFMYLVIEALANAGVKQGVPVSMAIRMAAQTTLGAAKMVMITGKHPNTLKSEVCRHCPKTSSGIKLLYDADIRDAILKAVAAASVPATICEDYGFEEDC